MGWNDEKQSISRSCALNFQVNSTHVIIFCFWDSSTQRMVIGIVLLLETH